MADDELRRLERLAASDPLAAERLAAARARAGRTPTADEAAARSARVAAGLDDVEAFGRALTGHGRGAVLVEVARGRLEGLPDGRGRAVSLVEEALPLLRAGGRPQPATLGAWVGAASLLARAGAAGRALEEVDVALVHLPAADAEVDWGGALRSFAAWPDAEAVRPRVVRALRAATFARLWSAVRAPGATQRLERLGLLDAAADALKDKLGARDARGWWQLDGVEALHRLDRATPADAAAALESLRARPADVHQASLLAALLDLAPAGARDACLAWAAGATDDATWPVRLAVLRRDLRGGAGPAAAGAFLDLVRAREAREDVSMRLVMGTLGAAATLGPPDEAALDALVRRGLDLRPWAAFAASEVLQVAAASAAHLPTLGPALLEEVARRADRLVEARAGAWWLGYDAIAVVARQACRLPGGVFEELVRPALERAFGNATGHRVDRGSDIARYFAAALLAGAAPVAAQRGDPGLARRCQGAAEQTLGLVDNLSILDLADRLAEGAAARASGDRLDAVSGLARALRGQAGRLDGSPHVAQLVRMVADLVDLVVHADP